MSRPRLMALLLALVTLLVYLPVSRHGFLDYDDDDYVTNNQIVQNGLTLAGLKWAFTTFHASNWHPLTWLSHMTDCGLFGLNPAAHHFVNVLIHAANAALLFVLLLRLTSALWPAAFVAALFAWHPLHVESVAWVAERKDMLSTFFALLSLLSYVKFVRASCRRSFWFALGFFALGLMAKPMIVTLPFVMLLLDYWPLKRFPDFGAGKTMITRLVTEKWPFFLLALVSCMVTYSAQRHGDAVIAFKYVSLGYRLENAAVAYAGYLQKIFWPAGLAVIYPMQEKISVLAAAAAAVGLIFVSAAVWQWRKRAPCLIVGWLWFLGMLVPVIGLVQVGGAALADRYTYLPAVGIFLAVTFGVCDLASRLHFPKIILPAASALILGACLMLTRKQLGYWRDSETLFAHTLAVTENNDIAHINLGVAFEQQQKWNAALDEYQAAARLAPARYQIHNNLGNVLFNLGRPAEALGEFQTAVRLDPNVPYLHNSLGITLAELGRDADALAEFNRAMQLDPGYASPHFEMAKLLLKQGHNAEAVARLNEALQRDPDNFNFLAYTAHVLAAIEDPQVRDGKSALVFAAKANILSGGSQPFVLDALGMACAETGDFAHATEVTQRALDLAVAAKMETAPPIQQRLELYKIHQPWRESFLATNAPAKN